MRETVDTSVDSEGGVTVTMTEAETYSTKEAQDMTGATYRQLDYWSRSKLIPGQDGPFGSGNHRRWTAEQVMRVQQLLRASRISAMSIGQLADWLDDLDRVMR